MWVTDDLQDSRAVQDRAIRRDIDIVLGHHLRDSGRVLCKPRQVPCRNQRFQFVSHTLPAIGDGLAEVMRLV